MILLLCFISLNLVCSDSSSHIPSIITEMPSTPIPSDSTPIRDICDDMINYYFKGNGEQIRDQIKPYLQRRLDASWKKTKIRQLEQVPLHRSSIQLDPLIERYINKKVSQALEEALTEEHQTRLRYQSEAGEKISKNQVAVITAITGVITAAITAGVTLAIALAT